MSFQRLEISLIITGFLIAQYVKHHLLPRVKVLTHLRWFNVSLSTISGKNPQTHPPTVSLVLQNTLLTCKRFRSAVAK